MFGSVLDSRLCGEFVGDKDPLELHGDLDRQMYIMMSCHM